MPEFNAGAVVLAAGDQVHDAVAGLMDVVIPAMVSSLGRIARDQGEKMYADRYSGSDDHNDNNAAEQRSRWPLITGVG